MEVSSSSPLRVKSIVMYYVLTCKQTGQVLLSARFLSGEFHEWRPCTCPHLRYTYGCALITLLEGWNQGNNTGQSYLVIAFNNRSHVISTWGFEPHSFLYFAARCSPLQWRNSPAREATHLFVHNKSLAYCSDQQEQCFSNREEMRKMVNF